MIVSVKYKIISRPLLDMIILYRPVFLNKEIVFILQSIPNYDCYQITESCGFRQPEKGWVTEAHPTLAC